jgi:hypothetical protein
VSAGFRRAPLRIRANLDLDSTNTSSADRYNASAHHLLEGSNMRRAVVRSSSFFVAVMAFSLNGCGAIMPQVVGSGKAATEKREAAPFTKIHASGAVQVDVKIGDEPSLEVTTDDNIIAHIKTEVNDGVLTVRNDLGSFQSGLGVKVTATVKELTGMNLSGASHGNAAGITGPTFAAEANGASKIKLAGTVEELTASCNGASTIHAFDLPAQKVSARANGASRIEVTAKEKLNASANGASSIRFAGPPNVQTIMMSGASSVQAR